MIIGLTGYAGSGKDTVAEYLVKEHGFTRLAFADKVRELAYRMNPTIDHGSSDIAYEVDGKGWDLAKQHPEVRIGLQEIGTACREVLGSDVWIQAIAESHAKRIVITDVRFVNEAEWLTNHERAKIIRVTRPGVGPVNDHPSETRMDNYPVDWTIDNAGSLIYLEEQIEYIITQIG